MIRWLVKWVIISTIATIVLSSVALGLYVYYFRKADPLLAHVKENIKWTDSDLAQFLDNCSEERLALLEHSLQIQYTNETALTRVNNIRQEFYDKSNSAISAKNYHEAVVWAAKKYGIDKEIAKSAPTFYLESLIVERIFCENWDNLSVDQRQEFINDIDRHGDIDKSAILLQTGKGAYSVLSFANNASFSLLKPLRFTSTLFSGPAGWAIRMISFGISAWNWGKADLETTTNFIIQIHHYKVEALQSRNINVQTLVRELSPIFLKAMENAKKFCGELFDISSSFVRTL